MKLTNLIHKTIIVLAFIVALPSMANNITYSADEVGIYIEYTLDELVQEDSEIYTGAKRFMLEDFGLLEAENYPSLLQRIESFQIPEGMKIGEINVTTETEIINCKAIPSNPKHLESDEKVMVGTILPYSGLWPYKNVALLESVSYRGNKIGRIAVAPLQYDYSRQQVVFAKKITVTIPFIPSPVRSRAASTGTVPAKTKGNLDKILSIHNSALDEDVAEIRNETGSATTLGLSPILPPSFNLGTPGPRMIVVTPIEFEQEAERFAKTKCRLGYTVNIKSMPTDSLLNPECTFRIIKRAYDQYQDLEHVLLFGGGNKIAAFAGEKPVLLKGETTPYYTDFYYSCLDAEDQDGWLYGSDLDDPELWLAYSKDVQDRIPDVTLGRLPGRTLAEIKIMVDKSLSYELNPPLNNARYFNNAVHFTESKRSSVTSDKDEYVFPYTMELLSSALENHKQNHDHYKYNIKKYYYRKPTDSIAKRYYNGITIPESVIEVLKNSCTAQDIVNEFNKGCGYVLYRGHGNVQIWSNAKFNTSHIASMTNKNTYPAVYAITCLSGQFYHPGKYVNQSLCEELLAAKDKGAAFAIGANRETIAGYNEHFMAGIFGAMYSGVDVEYDLPGTVNKKLFMHPYTSELGSIFQWAGENMMLKNYSAQWTCTNSSTQIAYQPQYNREVYHCFGDPTLHVYRNAPVIKVPTIVKQNGSIKIYHNGRKLVATRKSGDTAANYPVASGDYYEISDQMLENYDLSLIGEGYVPLFLSQDELTGIVPTPEFKIQSLDLKTSYVAAGYDKDAEDVYFTEYDIYGNVIDRVKGNGGEAILRRPEGFSIIVMQKDGLVLDSKTIK